MSRERFAIFSDDQLKIRLKFHEEGAVEMRAELLRRQIDSLPPIAVGSIITCKMGRISRMDVKVDRVFRNKDGRLSSVWGHHFLVSGKLSKQHHWIMAQEIYGLAK